MNVLFLSKLASNNSINKLYETSGINVGFAIQKFNRLFAQGLRENGADIQILSALPVSRKIKKKLLWCSRREEEDGLSYEYLPFINVSVIRQLCIYVSTIIKVLKWALITKGEKVIICDVLDTSICSAALLVRRIIGVNSVGFVTDMPGMMVSSEKKEKRTWKSRLSTGVIKAYISSFDKYIFLTEAANDVINIKHRPYLIMEGFSDMSMMKCEKRKLNNERKVILYAGGLYARYGLDTLVKAILCLDPHYCEMRLYGSGTFVEELKNKYCFNNNIKYMGVAVNSEIIQAELEADLLVNPRPTHEEFTKYSFPSKNIEYMSTGTPLLTTKLPGMPEEYCDYVYLFEDETVEGFANTLKKILDLPVEELLEKGRRAKEFVLSQKNYIEQGKRIIKLLTN